MGLQNVLGFGSGDSISVQMLYIGGVLSVNRYRTGRGIIRRDVKKWMDDLASIVSMCQRSKPGGIVRPPATVEVLCRFKDNRSVCDTHNLHKVIGDALKVGLEIDDRDIYFVDKQWELLPDPRGDSPHVQLKIRHGRR